MNAQTQPTTATSMPLAQTLLVLSLANATKVSQGMASHAKFLRSTNALKELTTATKTQHALTPRKRLLANAMTVLQGMASHATQPL